MSMTPVADLAKHVVPFRSQNDAEIVQDVDLQIQRSRHVTITTDVDYEQAGELLKGYAALVKRIAAFFEDDIATANKLHKSLCAKRKAALDRAEAEVARIKRAMGDWHAAKERARQQAEREAQAAAQAAEEERVTREAAALEASGQRELAAAVVEQALILPPVAVTVPSTTPKVAGVSMIEAWSFEIVNAALLPRAYLTPDLAKIRAVVTGMKGSQPIPGVRIFRADTVRVRG